MISFKKEYQQKLKKLKKKEEKIIAAIKKDSLSLKEKYINI